MAEWQTRMFKGHVRKSVGSSPTACTREKDNIADDIPPQLRAPIKKGVFLWEKEHSNLSASVCEEQTSINAVCDAMADAQTLRACSKECGYFCNISHSCNLVNNYIQFSPSAFVALFSVSLATICALHAPSYKILSSNFLSLNFS